MLPLAILATFALFFLRRSRVITVCLLVVCGSLWGAARGAQMVGQLSVWHELAGQTITVVGEISDDSAYNPKGQRDVRLQNVQMPGRSPPGQVRVTSFTLAQLRRGDKVRATGRVYEGFGNYQAAIYFASVSVVHENQSWIEKMRRQFVSGIYSVLPDTQASLSVGILVGIKSQLPDSLNEQLRALSLTHIVVASGYNLTVLIRLARSIFEKRSKYQTALFASLLMMAFAFVAGFSASMSRAVIVSGLSLVAWYYGRRIHPIVLLLFSAVITAAYNPLYLWADIGWWLSFLAFAGVLVLAPLVTHKLYGSKKPGFLAQLIIETFSAQIMTVPLMMCVFGNLSVIGIAANLLVVPFIPIIMLLTAITGTFSCLLPFWAGWAALPLSWLLIYILKVIENLADITWASIKVTAQADTMLVMYGALLIVCILLWLRTKHDFLAKSVIE